MAKRLKINDSLKWYPILSSEYFNKNFTFKTYMKASVEDNKKISFLVEKLQQLYPLNDSKFKRVKKLDQESNEKIHLNKYIESLLDNSFMNQDKDLLYKCNVYTKLALNLAKFYNSPSAAIIVDPKSGK